MISKRLIKEVAGVLFSQAIFPARCFRNRLIILAYHRVLDFNINDYPFDEEIISATSSQFEEQIRYIANRFTPLTFKDIQGYLENGINLPPKSIVITFDDGYFDNYEVCYPILKKYGVPAVFFVSIDCIGKQKIFWFEWLVYQLKKTKLRKIEIESLSIGNISLEGDRKTSINKILSIMKSVPEEDRQAGLLELYEKTGIKVENSDFTLVRPMTWDELRVLSSNGMEIGSHTKSHPVLSKCRDEQIYEELVESKLILEEKLRTNVVSVSYPVGGYDSFNDKVKRMTQKAGYSWGISYVQGINYYPFTDRFSLKRLHMEIDTNLRLFNFSLALYLIGLR